MCFIFFLVTRIMFQLLVINRIMLECTQLQIVCSLCVLAMSNNARPLFVYYTDSVPVLLISATYSTCNCSFAV